MMFGMPSMMRIDSRRTLPNLKQADAGVPFRMYFQGYGRCFVRNGMVPVVGCSRPIPPDDFPRYLGWPCHHGGSVGVSAPDRASNLWHCMLFYLPPWRPDRTRFLAAIIRQSRGLYDAARDQCKRNVAQPIDLTEMARCIYLNYPRVFEAYPPPMGGKGRRLRGVAVMLGGDEESLPPGAALRSNWGRIIVDFFDMPLLDVNALPTTLTSVCAIGPEG